jgi:hypothetical protein
MASLLSTLGKISLRTKHPKLSNIYVYFYSSVLSVLLASPLVLGGRNRCGGGITRPPPLSRRCPPCINTQCNGNDMLPFPKDCSKFCKCDHGVAVAFDCPQGLHFDPRRKVCNWPQHAACTGEVEGCEALKIH